MTNGDRACGRYQRYKATTNAVLEWLHDVTKPENKTAKCKVKKLGGRSADVAEWSVSQIYAAALEVVEAALPVPAAILHQLRTAIRLRHQYSLQMTPDDGHTHVLNTLRAIEVQWTPLVSVKRPTTRTPFDLTTFAPPNDDADVVRTRLAARSEAAGFQSVFFLLDLDNMNREVKLAWAMFKRGEMSLVAATAVTNACVHTVDELSKTLRIAHPHLKDLDHILALLVCEELLVDLVSDHAGLTLGTAVELVALAKRATIRQARPAAERTIAKTLKTTTTAASHLIDRILDKYEAPFSFANLEWTATLDASLVSLQHGLHTVLEILPPGVRSVLPDGFFDRYWSEPHELAYSPSDLHVTFLAHILPVLVLHDAGDVTLPHEATTQPLFSLLQTYIQTKEVSIALVFACQSLLWSLFYTQGTSDGAKVVDETRVTIARVTSQLMACRDNADGFFVPESTATSMDAALRWLADLRLATSPNKPFSQMEVDRAWFNPYMAGQLLLTITTEITFTLGLTTIDDIGQARMVLHLYNALRVLNKMPANKDLDNLVNMYERAKSVWSGDRPTTRGELVQTHLAHNRRTADVLAANLRHDTKDYATKLAYRNRLDHRSAVQKKTRRDKLDRRLFPTEPAHVSKAYRYVTRTTTADDWPLKKLPQALQIKDVVDRDLDGFLYLNLCMVGQLFRGAWKEMGTTFSFNNLMLVSGIFDGPWRPHPNVRLDNENDYWFEALLVLWDRDPDKDRVAKVAEALLHVAERLHEAYVVPPAVAP